MPPPLRWPWQTEFARSQTLAGELEKAYPEDTAVQSGYLPTLRGLAAIGGAAIGGKDPQEAIDLLQVNSAYEFGVPRLDFNTYFGGLYPVYVRGLAYLAMNQGAKAAAEFRKILDHKGLTVGVPVSAMARLQLGPLLRPSRATPPRRAPPTRISWLCGETPIPTSPS
jgi:eukaryotic-like serine/threonine-protein kinase